MPWRASTRAPSASPRCRCRRRGPAFAPSRWRRTAACGSWGAGAAGSASSSDLPALRRARVPQLSRYESCRGEFRSLRHDMEAALRARMRAMPRTVGVVTVARSDYGHLVPVLQEIQAAPDLELGVYVAGSHLATRFGRTVTAVETDRS